MLVFPCKYSALNQRHRLEFRFCIRQNVLTYTRHLNTGYFAFLSCYPAWFLESAYYAQNFTYYAFDHCSKIKPIMLKIMQDYA